MVLDHCLLIVLTRMAMLVQVNGAGGLDRVSVYRKENNRDAHNLFLFTLCCYECCLFEVSTYFQSFVFGKEDKFIAPSLAFVIHRWFVGG